MIKTLIFRCKLDGLSVEECDLRELLEKVGAAIQSVHADALIDPSVECSQTVSGQQIGATSEAAAGADGYMEVKRKNGGVEYYYAPGDGTHRAITKEEYDAAHAGPEMQAQLEHARQVSAEQLNGAG